ncbi:hypothetical protein AVEN_218176-1 [Araneus ventricosus]|uniref:DUF4817 domain-containing protein n=1 Tax=Araneus ventricosus TaxID=182803 RepID=A0A4Y2PWX3_ARAVE|nr:hypothetical protein AVEN_218176-1 [Araneus ventricosus]
MYGLANGNALEAERLYRQRFPRRHLPERKMFERLHRCLCETGSFVNGMHATGRGRSVRTPQVVEDILQKVEDRPDISKREISRAVNVLHSIVRRVLRDDPTMYRKCKPSYLQIMRNVSSLQQLAAQPDFSAHVLFTDESTFTREDISKTYNIHVWASSNPYGTRPHAYQKRFSVNVSAGILGIARVTSTCCSRQTSTYVVPARPPHFSLDVRSALDAKFTPRCIGRGGPTHCTALSPDLSSLDIFLWAHSKSLVWTLLPGLLLLPETPKKCRVCLKKCAARYVAGETPALPQVVSLLISFYNFATDVKNII